MTLPPEPMTSRILSVGILMVMMRGANSDSSSRGTRDGLEHLAEDEGAAFLGLHERLGAGCRRDRPLALLSICMAVMPFAVPATLKSMSPRKSSRPWMSVRTATSSPSLMSPIAMPETGAAIGTPASMSASVEPQTEPIELEPLDSSTSDTMRIVYGNSSSAGMTGQQRTLGERTVADVAALRAAHEAGLARGERREVVVVDVALALGRRRSCRCAATRRACRASAPRAPASGRG